MGNHGVSRKSWVYFVNQITYGWESLLQEGEEDAGQRSPCNQMIFNFRSLQEPCVASVNRNTRAKCKDLIFSSGTRSATRKIVSVTTGNRFGCNCLGVKHMKRKSNWSNWVP